MKVLVVGGGGREHALCVGISKSPLCQKLYCAPGNAGIAAVATCLPIGAEDIPALVAAAQEQAIDFVVIGPDKTIALGLADRLAEAGIPCFGPSQAAGRIESSKSFMKDVCTKAGVPTARYQRFTDASAAHAYVKAEGAPIVIKADGLAAGKGVTVARTIPEALAAIDDALVERIFGESGASLVIEEFMEGEEVSFFVLCDRQGAKFFASAQDHKAAYDGDKGPNTGGMGAYSPAPVIDKEMEERVMREIIQPTLAELQKRGCPFTGVLYAGLMMTKTGPKIVEFNARFGDPETQVMLPRLKSDLLALLYACSKDMLDGVELEWHDSAAVTVVLATRGYPGAYGKGSIIRGVEAADTVPDAFVYHAGTARNSAGDLTANGGRVLCVTAPAPTLSLAKKRAYEAVDHIDWPEGFCRRDIGGRL